jgi:hypothetical protein
VTAGDRYFTPNMDSMGYQGNGSRHKQTDPKGTRVIGGGYTEPEDTKPRDEYTEPEDTKPRDD